MTSVAGIDVMEQMPETGDRMMLLSGPVEHSVTITKSEFIAFLAPVYSVDEADRVIRERRALHPNARHHCTALFLGTPTTLQRSNDDGEPGGTGGMPMANGLRGRHMTNVVAVVTRYFGGIKLGAGGLVRAYGGAVTAALDEAERRGLILERVVRQVTALDVGYDLAGPFEANIRAWAAEPIGAGRGPRAEVMSADYASDGVTIHLAHEPETAGALSEAVAEASAGAVWPRSVGYAFTDVPLDSTH